VVPASPSPADVGASPAGTATPAPAGATPDPEGLRHSPLEAQHRALGAKLVPFGGWLMPLQYGEGTLSEHRACRQDVAVFDVSHLGTVRVEGPGSFETLQRELSNDLRKIGPGRAQYTHLLDPDDGSVVDDIIVWWLAEDRFDVMPNASNTARVLGAVGGRDVTADRAVLAVQGPGARRVVATVAPDAATVGRFAVAGFEFAGTPCTVAGTGYTGEDGVECAAPAAVAPLLWEALVGAGAVPAGLGARDTLRLEAGLPLHGHELGPGVTPLQAGLGWVVGWGKGEFRGRGALEAERDAGVRRRLAGLVGDGRQPLREGATVRAGDGPVGRVTSGNFSPVLGRGIGMAFLDTTAGLGPGDAVSVELRGRALAAQVTDLPFVDHRPRGRT
jgi:aminomethyltransferase